ncbi:MAG: hypothetical protein INR62_07135, partial [Rhodospirillales bacterium]|nr:hypothetical protein [Acetobacter sp.]
MNTTINANSVLNLDLTNRSHESMISPSPILPVPTYHPEPAAHRRFQATRCYEEPGGVLCLEEADAPLEPAKVVTLFQPVDEPGPGPASAALTSLMAESLVMAAPALDATTPAPGNESNSEFGDLPELDPSLPEVASFLLSAREQRATEDAPLPKDVGRDFNDLPCEVALLSACITEPKEALDRIVDDMHSEIFYDRRHRAIFMAVLDLMEVGKSVTAASVLGRLKDTEGELSPDYLSYFDRILDVRYNINHLPFYMTRLQRAARRRGGEAYCQFGFSEPFSAYLLLQRVPDMKFLGDDLHVYHGGVWGKEDRKMFGAKAMNCIHPRHQSAKRAQAVLDYVGMIRQVRQDTFCGAYKKVGDLILINANNGVVEVLPNGTVIVRGHSKDDFFSLKLAADYDPSATCKTFLSVLNDALPDQADRDVLQVFGGYLLYPGCDYEVSLVCYGPGGTGKSTILNGIGSVLGQGLCGKASLEELCKTSGYSLPTIRDKMLN